MINVRKEIMLLFVCLGNYIILKSLTHAPICRIYNKDVDEDLMFAL